MTKQVQCTGELTIADGKIDEFKRIIPSFIEAVKKNEPDMNAFQVYLNAGETKAYLVEWYKNSAAILVHWANVEPMLPELMAVAPYSRLEFFGDLTKEVEEALKPLGAPIFKYHQGFIRGDTPSTEVPDEIVGSWADGSFDFELWENYREGYWAGKNASPTREAMVFSKNGEAKFYRYEFAFTLYEELIDCTGTVTFHDNGTFTFYPVQGRKRFYDTIHHGEGNTDRPLNGNELSEPKLAGTRGYAYNGSVDPPVIRITVPSSAPYNWYKLS